MAGMLLMGAGCATNHQVAIPAGSANDEALVTTPSAEEMRLRGQEYKEAQAVQSAAPANDEAAAPVAAADSAAPAVKPPKPTSFPGVLPAEQIHGKQVRVETNKGMIVFDLLDGEAPKAASNFVALAMSGYYDGLLWHRVEPGFVIQGGDPLGTGFGGPGYKFEDEPVTLNYDAGIVAMANSGANTNGSQFFIMLEDTPLPKKYTIFGRVTSGLDVVRKIAVGDKMLSVTVEDKR